MIRDYSKFVSRKPVKLELGADYEVRWYRYTYTTICRFIKPTKCGFNLLNLETNKCILPTHLYKSKRERYQDGDWFFVNENMYLKKYKKKKEENGKEKNSLLSRIKARGSR